MSKFIRLTLRENGSADYHNTDCILGFEKSNDGGSLVRFSDTYNHYSETPEQILALIQGDEQRERIAFLESALWDAKMLMGIWVTPKGDFLADDWATERKLSNSFAQWLREVSA